MRQNVRRQLRVLRAYAVVNSLVLIVLATARSDRRRRSSTKPPPSG